MSTSPANKNDIPELVSLINSAYRGEESKKGWTTEADLLQGELRIDQDTLTELITEPGAIMLKYTSENGTITGCVFLHQQSRGLYLGMLSVNPGLQGSGIGKKLLQGAENYAKEKDCPAIFMQVISVRHELIAWYEKNGYRPTGEIKPFPNDTRFGIPTQSLEFILLEKILGEEVTRDDHDH